MDASVTLDIPCMHTFPDHMALEILSTELGKVNMYLYACKSLWYVCGKLTGD